MIQFPITATREWGSAAARVEKSVSVREKVAREVKVSDSVESMWVRHEAKLVFEQGLAAQDTPPLEMVSLAEHLSNPAATPTDAIEGVVREDGITVVLGPSGAGKSTVALQLVHSLITGTPFLNQRVLQQVVGGIGVLSYDMDASMMLNWMSGWTGPGIDQTRILAVNAHRQGNPLAVPYQRQQIVDAWQTNKTEVVVIDSFSASFFGADQNDAAATMAHYRELKKFALTEVGAKILILVVHSSPGSAAKARGSSVHQDAPDAVLAVEKNKEGYRDLWMNKYRTIAGSTSVEMPRVTIGSPDPKTNLFQIHHGETVINGEPGSTDHLFPDAVEDPNVDATSTEDEEGEDAQQD